MAGVENIPVHGEDDNYQSTVVTYLLDRQQHDPGFMRRLARQLHDDLPPIERDVRYSQAAAELPGDDILGRQNLVLSRLLLEYIHDESAMRRELYASPENPGKHRQPD
jgi:hypothetical protein